MLELLIKSTTPFKEQKLISQTEYTANKSTFVTFNNQSKSTENKPNLSIEKFIINILITSLSDYHFNYWHFKYNFC